MAFDWSQLGSPLQGIGSGLMAAGAGGWQQFAPAYARGALLGQQQLQYKDEKKIRDLQAQEMQAALEQQRTENQDKEAHRKAYIDYVTNHGGIMGPGTATPPIGSNGPQLSPGIMQSGGPQFSPEQWKYLQGVSPDVGEGIIGNQLFAPADKPDKWDITTIREGNQDVTYRINPQTGEREKLGSGAAWAPQQPNGSGQEMGLAPFYTVDDKGVTHAWQLSKGGGAKEIALAPGQRVAPQTQFLDLGTSMQPVDKRNPGGSVAPSLPVDVSGKAKETDVGQGAAAATVALPQAAASADQAIALIDDLKSDPARKWATGATTYVASRIPGTAGYDYTKKVDQLKGKVFLEAYAGLKGGGAITEVEGSKATEAIGRLDTAQSEDAFVKALDDLSEVIKSGKDRLARKAAGDFSPDRGGSSRVNIPAAGSGPAPGSVEDGYRFKGGNPADPNSWEPAQ